jgi:hypothetical protein
MEYGDLSIKPEVVGEFIGDCSKREPTFKSFLSFFNTEETKDYDTTNAVDSRDIKLHYYYA